MSLESDVQYWQNRNWDALNPHNQLTAQEFEKCKRTYTQAIKEGIIDSDDPNLSFKFTARKWTKTSFTIEEVLRALLNLNYITKDMEPRLKQELTDYLIAMNPTKEAYYLKFR